jgi:rhamnogalacturonyl hydrolase YesR
MSSTPAVPATIHPSFWARAATWVKHEAITIRNVIEKIAGLTPAITAEIQKVAPTVEALSNMILPGSGAFEAHLIDVWSVAASAVDAAGAAAAANGVSVTLDQNLVNAIKGFIPAVKSKMSSAAGTAPAV